MENFDFEDVNLIPARCIVKSRRECDTSLELGGRVFKIPAVPANMPAIINREMCKYLAANGYFYIYHRFRNDALDFMAEMEREGLFTSISIGFGDNAELFAAMQARGLKPDYMTLDVAHADSIYLKDCVRAVKAAFPATFLIVGNISAASAVADMVKDGIYDQIDALKIGIAPGKVCITQQKTGFGSRGNQMATIKKLADYIAAHDSSGRMKLIADGGISSCGDAIKALAAGADLVMCGSLFSGADETPGDIIEIEGRRFKEYYGSASLKNKTARKNIEGKNILVPHKGPLQQILTELQEDIQSGISYGGGKRLKDLRQVKWDFLHR